MSGDSFGVYAAINAVQKALCKEGITKDQTNTQGTGYKFRGIDDVYNAISPLLAEHGLCIIPRFIARHCDERTSKSGGALFYVTVEAEFDFVSTKDGSKHTARTFGEAMDSGDKATNKAMSAAYKYAAFQAFAIPTEADNDADAHTPQPAPKPESSKSIGQSDFDKLPDDRKKVVADLHVEIADTFRDTGEGEAYDLYEQAKDNLPTVEEKTALWGLLSSQCRAAIKKVGTARKQAISATDAANTP